MRTFKIIGTFSLVVMPLLAGCVPSSHTADTHVIQTSSAIVQDAVNAEYLPNPIAPIPIGWMMATPEGSTVYTFDRDQLGKSACYDDCARHWLPVIAHGVVKAQGGMSLVERTDGQLQWAYKGRPLYTFIEDAARGDAKGDSVDNAWHVVR